VRNYFLFIAILSIFDTLFTKLKQMLILILPKNISLYKLFKTIQALNKNIIISRNLGDFKYNNTDFLKYLFYILLLYLLIFSKNS